MAKCILKVLFSTTIIMLLFSSSMTETVLAGRDEIISGFVVKNGKNFVIEADDGDYIAKGKDISNLVGKMVLVTGEITESSKGSTIQIKSIEDMQEMQDNQPD